MGTLVGHANRPLTAEFCRRAMIKNTLSLSWRIGRAVMLANKEAQIGRIGEVVIDALGGTRTGRVLFAGKITSVTRKVYKGHTVGEVIIGSVLPDEDDGPRFEGSLKSKRGTKPGLNRSPFQKRKPSCGTYHRGRIDHIMHGAGPHFCPRCRKRPCIRYTRLQVWAEGCRYRDMCRSSVDRH